MRAGQIETLSKRKQVRNKLQSYEKTISISNKTMNRDILIDIPIKNSNQYALSMASRNCFTFSASSSSEQMVVLSVFSGRKFVKSELL